MEKTNQHGLPPPVQHFVITVNGRKIEFAEQLVLARKILDAAGYEGEFCLAATLGESGKVTQTFADTDRVELHEFKHFRATFCGSEVVS